MAETPGLQFSMPSWVEEPTSIAVGANINVSGKLVFNKPVRIEGHFRGEVSSIDLIVITEAGSIEGKIKAPRLVVLGEVRGEITGSRHVMLGPRARVSGRIESEQLAVSEGARLEAQLHISGVSAPANSDYTD
ncbi:MAG: polymer-forming cytoskeletal protein [Candidatus Binataceae bacterium]|nr:polymer-forming cytoskeletal protein [Candidatus Binataceae bacterium]